MRQWKAKEMKHDFDVNVEVQNQTGEVLAVYFQSRKGKSAETREFDNGRVFADYDKRGRLLGIELLGPTQIAVLDQITMKEPETQRFVHRSVPRQMALA
jgi:uncharacterized protein YuzE